MAKAGEVSELVRCAEAVEREVGRLEELSRAARRIKLNTEKNITRAARELQQTMEQQERLARELRMFGEAMGQMQTRQLAAVEPLSTRAIEIQERVNRFSEHMQRFGALGVRAKEIRVTGGGAKSAVWRQIMADVFGVPVVGMVEEEGAALGAALQAAWCVGLRQGRRTKLSDLTSGVVALDESTRCTPDRARVARYRELQALQDETSRASRDLFPQQRKLLRNR